MSFADPTLTFGSTPILLPRTASGVNQGAFTSSDGLIKLGISHTYGKRVRRSIRLDHSKIAADPFTSTLQVPMSMSAYVVIDAPKLGYTIAQQKEAVDALTAYLTASTGARVTQLLGGEN